MAATMAINRRLVLSDTRKRAPMVDLDSHDEYGPATDVVIVSADTEAEQHRVSSFEAELALAKRYASERLFWFAMSQNG